MNARGATLDQTARRRRVLVLGASLALGGCGFKLRAGAELPFRTIHGAFAPGSGVGLEFARAMRNAANVRLVAREAEAEVRLQTIRELREKETVGFSSTGRAREVQLRLRYAFRLLDAQGNELVPPNELILRRDLTTSDAQAVAKEQEEALLYREMESDIVEQLLRRLGAVRR
jgi:LPS-assembly lipoprotein